MAASKAKQQIKKKSKGRPQKVSDDDIAIALIKCKGFLSDVANLLKVNASTISKRVTKSEFLTSIRTEAEDKMLDVAENALVTMIENSEHNDHFKSVKFFLKCKGKKRGYIENIITLNSTEDKPLPINFGTEPDVKT